MTGSDDRLAWIFDAGRSGDDLAASYDRWAEDYDADHASWGWLGPRHLVEELGRLSPAWFDASVEAPTVIDAGCGTGAVGVALRDGGFTGPVVGLDLSLGMLIRARDTGAYRSLLRGSLTDLPFPSAVAAGVVSAGVFTHGHVGPEALQELCRAAEPGGLVVITRRVDLTEAHRPVVDDLEARGRWRPVASTEPAPFHPGRDDGVEQSIVSWRVLEPEA